METPETQAQNREYFIKLAGMRMPFGRYNGWLLINLPEAYLLWFRQKGFPKGELGKMLESVLEIKINGLEYLFDPFVGNKVSLTLSRTIAGGNSKRRLKNT
jgi:uncharacterized protein (DUF3820 family)